MSTATKVFTVLLVVLAIAFSMATVSFVARTHDWRKLATDYRRQAHAAYTQLANVEAISKAELAQMADKARALGEDIAGLQDQLAQTQNNLDDLKKQLASETISRQRLEGNNTKLAATLKAAQDEGERLRQHRDALLTENADLAKRNIDLGERTRELTDRVARLDQEVKAGQQREFNYQQQIGELNKQLKVAKVAEPPTVIGRKPGEDIPMSPREVVPIRGTIVEIHGNLASIDVGSSSGVGKGMIFIVYRGSQYLGKLSVELIEPNRSGGTITSSVGETIRVGDLVVDEARFGADQ